MRYVLKQKVLTLTDSFTIKNDQGQGVYKVKGKLISVGDRLSFQHMDGEEIAKIKEELISITPSYRVYREDKLLADVDKKLFGVLGDKFKVKMKDGSEDLEIRGNILDFEYRFKRGGDEVARVTKKWVSIGDSYGVEIEAGEDDVLILACAVIVDMIAHGSEDDPGEDEV